MNITTPDGMTYRATSLDEATAFVAGFCAALDCFGIYRDGVQVIGCQEAQISTYKTQMKQQVAIQPPTPPTP